VALTPDGSKRLAAYVTPVEPTTSRALAASGEASSVRRAPRRRDKRERRLAGMTGLSSSFGKKRAKGDDEERNGAGLATVSVSREQRQRLRKKQATGRRTTAGLLAGTTRDATRRSG
jgi:hypothetical protein